MKRFVAQTSFNARLWWQRRKTCVLLITAACLVFMCTSKQLEHTSQTDLQPGVSARSVAHFIADFSNEKLLQPGMDNFRVIAESGNYKDWRYSAVYEYQTIWWPHVTARTTAHYTVQTDRNVTSEHRTCYLDKFFCFNWHSFQQVRDGQDGRATYTQRLRYSCPRALATLCARHVAALAHNYLSGLHLHAPNPVH